MSDGTPKAYRIDFPDCDAEDVQLRWHHKEIQMWVAGKVERQSPGLWEILEELVGWLDDYLAGNLCDTWPRVVEDCTGEGIDELREPWQFDEKMAALALRRHDAEEAAWEDKRDAEREERRLGHVYG